MRVAVLTLLLLLLPRPAAAQNLLTNGDFEKWNAEQTEPAGWHTHMTSIIPVPEYRDPEKKEGRTGKYTFKCGCGHVWGAVRPWAFLFCPQCKQLNHGLEDSGSWYDKNFECIKTGAGKSGKGLAYKLPTAVGNNQGVRCISELIKAERGAGYELSFDALSKGCHLRVFVECFQQIATDKEAADWVKALPAEVNPLKQTLRLKRGYRESVNVESPGAWTHVSRKFYAPYRYEFDYMFVDLYAYMPGEAAYDNVVLRKLTPAELAQLKKDDPGPKDQRLR